MTHELWQPGYWLVLGLPWPDDAGAMGEGALAIAPPIVARDALPRDGADILAVADAYHAVRPGRVVFFSDLTLWLDSHGQTWPFRDTDWETGCEQLATATPGLYVTVSWRAYVILCDASREGVIFHYTDGTPPEHTTRRERQAVRAAVEHRLAVDWPDYVQDLIDSGRLRPLNDRTANGE